MVRTAELEYLAAGIRLFHSVPVVAGVVRGPFSIVIRSDSGIGSAFRYHSNQVFRRGRRNLSPVFAVFGEKDNARAADEPANSRLRRGTGSKFGGGIQEVTLPGDAAVLGNFHEAAGSDAIEHIGIGRRNYSFGITRLSWFCFSQGFCCGRTAQALARDSERLRFSLRAWRGRGRRGFHGVG